LQFDVTAARLAAEYGVQASYEPMQYVTVRWIDSKDRNALQEFKKRYANTLVQDAEGHLALLFSSRYRLDRAMEDWPKIRFLETREN
jgi:peptide chain release factor 3